MAGTCYDTNLLMYSGTSQAQRILTALRAQHVQADERTTAQLILFAKEYGAYLNYYDATNQPAGDWQSFMEKDVSVIIATIAGWRVKDITPFIEHINEEVHVAGSDEEAKKYFKTIFDLVFTLATQLDESLRLLPADVRFTGFLPVAIASNLAIPLSALYDYYTKFRDAPLPLINESSTYPDPLMPVDRIVSSGSFKRDDLSKAWNTSSLPALPLTVKGTDVREDISHILTHNLFTGPLQLFVNGVINIVSKTPAYLEETLNNYPLHQPQYALYLAFLRLFRFAQDHLNNFTRNHLDFYYKEVLQLKNRNAQPAFVHLIFELQKNAERYLLTKGTAFKAGKDEANHDVSYALTDDVVIQKASVQSLQSLYLDKGSGAALYASPVAGSEDGNGGKLSSADSSWPAFGDPGKIDHAGIGFAIASNVLFLNEGKRTVVFTFQCNDLSGITAEDLAGAFTIRFTAKKNWYTASYTVEAGSASFTLTVELDGDAPPIVPYSQKIHKGNFNATVPMVQALLSHPQSYNTIKGIRITGISLNAFATVKNLSLQNDNGKINAAKPFKPFGEFPEENASLIIGSKEIFQKPLVFLSVEFDWQQAHASMPLVVELLSLAAGKWSAAALATSSDLYTGFIEILYGLDVNIPVISADFTPNDDYTIDAVSGFIKLQLKTDQYSLSSYLSGIQKALEQTSTSVTANYADNANPDHVTSYTVQPPALSAPAPQIVAGSVKVLYISETAIGLSATGPATVATGTSSYYHIEPFGFREMHPDLTSDPVTLLPVFDLDDGKPPDGGELWIGLKDAFPSETLSLLFQVAEGSANPLKSMTQVSWYYMAHNNWIQFDARAVSDQTNNLTRSGIVTCKLPADATSGNTRADASLTWIKLAAYDTEAVCKLIAVRSNAAKAAFMQDLSKGMEFTGILPAGTIGKPATAIAAIKKTEQPFTSFGGRQHETDDQFYIRVSERLRHKHRAVTAWDYERLVLDNFPQIHKVKCIQHTGLISNAKTTSQKYSEVLPGHVMVVTVPQLMNTFSVNPLRPYTSVGLLEEIGQYLKNLTSPFVRLNVINPQFEEVQFDFQVTFYQGYDQSYYLDMLNNEIEQFLTPWAYSNAKDIEFGGKIEKSVVLNFVEERHYVDFVTCFKMHHIIRKDSAVISTLYNIEEAVASTAHAILVSYYNEDTKTKHIIQSPANCNCDG